MENKKNLSQKKNNENTVYKIVICAIVLCAVVGIMLAMYNSIVPDTLAKYEEEGKMEHTAWLVRYGSYVPPVIVLAVVLTCFYSFGSSYIPVKTQRDKAIIVGIVFAFTYLILLPGVMLSSPGWNLPDVEGEEVKTAFETLAGWFFAQLVPFSIWLSYHLVRMSSEKKELLKNEE